MFLGLVTSNNWVWALLFSTGLINLESYNVEKMT